MLVVGSGGLGKTALAVHVAHLLAGRFGDGPLVYANLRGAHRARYDGGGCAGGAGVVEAGCALGRCRWACGVDRGGAA